MNDKENIENIENEYVANYRFILFVVGIMIFITGVMVGQSNKLAMFYVWVVGGIFLVFMNMLKDILHELRKMNSNLK